MDAGNITFVPGTGDWRASFQWKRTSVIAPISDVAQSPHAPPFVGEPLCHISDWYNNRRTLQLLRGLRANLPAGALRAVRVFSDSSKAVPSVNKGTVDERIDGASRE